MGSDLNRFHAAIVLSLPGLHFAAAINAATPGIELGPCDHIAVTAARCGTLRVPENRADPAGRTIDIHVAVAAASGPDPLPDPIFFFHGGPGAAASDQAAGNIERWRALNTRRDLVFIDQRGTGLSAPLHCRFIGDPDDPDTYAIDLFDLQHLRACRDHHRNRADLTRYATADALQDVESVRTALGYTLINAVGISYGTRVVQEYIRRHPGRVRAALLLGAVPPARSITEGMARSLDATLNQLFDSCDADPACRAAYPRLRSDTAGLLRHARDQGVAATIALDAAAARETVISYQQLVAWIRGRLYSVADSARLPRALSQAARGDAGEVVLGAIRWRRQLTRSLSEGMYASVACAEDMPFVDVEAELAEAAGTWMGGHRVISQQAACAIWPRAAVPADLKTPVTAPTPILVINGDRDPATSLAWARAIVERAPNAHLVVASNRSHSLAFAWQDCLGPLAGQFIDRAAVDAVDDACAARLALPPFVTDGAPQ